MKRPFLLDTCAAIWVAGGDIDPGVAQTLTEAANAGPGVHVSPITAWEIGVLARKGRFRSSLAPARWFETFMRTPGLTLAAMSPSVLIASSFLPEFKSGDPADRIIAATAREHGYVVVTRDAALIEYGAQGYLNILEC